MTKIARAAVFLALVAHVPASPAAQAPRNAIFVINTNEFSDVFAAMVRVEGRAARHPRKDLDATLRPYLTHGRRAGRVTT